MEMFRSQVVDRVVISLVQKREPLELMDGLLTDNTKRLLTANIAERLQKREKYRGEEMTMERIIDTETDQVVIYPLCMDCFAKIRYLPENKPDSKSVAVL